MKTSTCKWILPAGLLLAGLFSYAGELATDKQKTGYALGVSIGDGLHAVSEGFDIDALAEGIRDVVAERPLKMDRSQIEAHLLEYKRQLVQDAVQAYSER